MQLLLLIFVYSFCITCQNCEDGYGEVKGLCREKLLDSQEMKRESEITTQVQIEVTSSRSKVKNQSKRLCPDGYMFIRGLCRKLVPC